MMKTFFERKIKSLPFMLMLAALVLLFSATREAHAQNSGAGRGEGGQEAGERQDRLADELRLTPDQIARITAIREQTREERRVINQRLKEAQRALEDAIYADNASEALIEERSRELAAAQTEAIRLRARTELNIRRVLTPEQLSSLRAMREDARLRQERRQQQRRLLNPGHERSPGTGQEHRPDSTAPPDRRDGNMRPDGFGGMGPPGPSAGPHAPRRGGFPRPRP